MRILRRKRARRLIVVAAVVMGGLVAWQLVRAASEETYLPGEMSAGVFDSLARRLPPDHPGFAFRDVAAEVGLAFEHFPATRTNRLPEDMGSGVALGDVDGDGWTDVFLVNAAGPLSEASTGWSAGGGRCRLFRNLGDGTFADVTDVAGIDLTLLGMAAAFVDTDGDRDLDLLVTSHGRCHLLANDGTGRFTDVSAAAGLAAHEGFWAGVAVGDYDRDDDVDLYVCGYVRYVEDLGEAARMSRQYQAEIPALINPSVFEPERNLLLRNRGDGTFEDVAAAAGVADTTGRGLAASFVDLSGDGWPDLYVANDVSDNVLYVNRGDGTFEDLTSQALVGDYRGAMGLAVADFDADLDLDLFITHWVAQENALYVNVTDELAEQGRPPLLMFVDEADRHGLGRIALSMVGWATGFVDVDNDGMLDLFTVNGSTIPMKDDVTLLEPMRTQLFWKAPGRGYFDMGPVAGPFFQREIVGRGGAAFDYDLDGDEDLVVVLHGDQVALLRNELCTPGDARRGGHVLRVRLRRPSGNTFALGSVVRLEAGGRPRIAPLGAQGSYLSQHAVGEVAFGLGDTDTVDRLEVTWPDGTTESAGPFPADRLVTWMAGSAPRVERLPGGPPVAAMRTGTTEPAVSEAGGGARPSEARLGNVLGRGGPRASAPGKPTDVDAQRRFFALRDEATSRRIAGDLQGAVASYEDALALWPGHEDCLYYLGNCLAGLGREREAADAFGQLAERHPASSKAWMQLGRLAMPGGDPGLDDLAAAGEAFERAHRINAEDSGPLVQLGLVALLRGDRSGADDWLAAAAGVNARCVEAPYFRGYLAWLRGERELAETLLDEARASASGAAGRGDSVSSEGDTRSGRALVASLPDVERDATGLDRWRSVLARPADVDGEYGPLALP